MNNSYLSLLLRHSDSDEVLKFLWFFVTPNKYISCSDAEYKESFQKVCNLMFGLVCSFISPNKIIFSADTEMCMTLKIFLFFVLNQQQHCF